MRFTHAVVKSPLTPVRSAPSVRAEQTSQEPLGGVLRILDRDGDWVLARGEDAYEGWVHTGALLLGDEAGSEAWWDGRGGRPALALDLELRDEDGDILVRLPWGARIAVEGHIAHLPDGRSGRTATGEWSLWEERGSGRFARTGAAVVQTARQWQGVPYVWGGRTRWGADCSGMVQMVYRLHGVMLPRDSYQQGEVGEPLDAGDEFQDVVPGDLLFFHARDSARIVHVAISCGGYRVIHAAEPNGEVMEDDLGRGGGLGTSLAKRLAGVRRLFSSDQ